MSHQCTMAKKVSKGSKILTKELLECEFWRILSKAFSASGWPDLEKVVIASRCKIPTIR